MSNLVAPSPKPTLTDDFKSEIESIEQEYALGTLAQEYAFLRVARLVITEMFVGQIVVDKQSGEKIVFQDQKDLLDYVCRVYNISAMTVKNRLRAYRRLITGGKSYTDSLKIIMFSPGLPERVTRQVGTFSDDGEMLSVDVDKAIGLSQYSPREDYMDILNDDDPDAKKRAVLQAAGNLMEEASELPSRNEAAKLVDRVLINDKSVFYRNGDGAVIGEYTRRSVDEDGVVYDEPKLVIEWSPVQPVPAWAQEKFYERLRAIERMKQDD